MFRSAAALLAVLGSLPSFGPPFRRRINVDHRSKQSFELQLCISVLPSQVQDNMALVTDSGCSVPTGPWGDFLACAFAWGHHGLCSRARGRPCWPTCLTHRLDFLGSGLSVEHHVVIGPESPGSSGWRVTHTHIQTPIQDSPTLSSFLSESSFLLKCLYYILWLWLHLLISCT